MNNPFISLKSSPIIKNASENICNKVLTLDNFVTFKFVRSFGAESLNPETRTSLIIINDGYINRPSIFEIATKMKITEITRILSATGSKNFPKEDSTENLLARNPSKNLLYKQVRKK